MNFFILHREADDEGGVRGSGSTVPSVMGHELTWTCGQVTARRV